MFEYWWHYKSAKIFVRWCKEYKLLIYNDIAKKLQRYNIRSISSVAVKEYYLLDN